MATRTAVRRVAQLVLLLGLLLLAWTLVVLVLVRGDLNDARTALERARDAQDTAVALPALVAAESDLRAAVGRLDQPGPLVTARVPLVGRSVRAVDRAAKASLAVVSGGAAVLRAVEPDGAQSSLLRDGQVDLRRLAAVEEALADAAARAEDPVRELAEQPLGLVPSFIAGPVEQARAELDGSPADLAAAAAGVRGVAHVLGADGPRRLLVLLENNAELRATGGLVSVYAEATSQDGRLTLAGFQDVEAVADRADEARTVPAPADYVDLYGPYKANTTLWKNANMSADIPTSSAVVAGIAQASLGRRPDAVLWLDIPAVAAVLRATGPAVLPDGDELSAQDAVPRLLSTAYRETPDDDAGQDARRAALRGAADAVLGRLLGDGVGEVPAAALARELLTAARGRHLALWSGEPTVQADLRAAGLSGAVAADGGDLSSFSVHNLGGGDADGNKLDYYARRQVSVDVTLDETSALVEQEVALRNTAPERGLPRYVAGRGTPGVSNNFVFLALPAGAELLAFGREGRSLAVEPRRSGDHLVLTDAISLPPGTTATWTLRYRVPVVDNTYRMALLPQPLAVDAGLSVTVRGPDGWDLRSAQLMASGDGALTLSQAFQEALAVEVTLDEPGLLQRTRRAVQRFWNEPVRLP